MHWVSRLVPTLAVVSVFQNMAHAHPGHATQIISPDSGWHYVLQPEHAAVGLAALLISSLAIHTWNRRRTTRLTPIPVRRDG